jgi:hypothetical protein
MPKGDISAVERIIANTINETARGDPDALAARIVAALAEAGFRIVAASGRGDTALGPQRAKTQLLRHRYGVGREKQCCIRDVPCRSHPAAQRKREGDNSDASRHSKGSNPGKSPADSVAGCPKRGPSDLLPVAHRTG